MTRISTALLLPPDNRHWLCLLRHGMMAALLLAAAICLSAQTQPAPAQQGGSLADLARQVRAQKGQANTDSSQAQQVAAELSEDQNDGGVPGGFKTYNAGDYKLWVPAPYRVEGQDDAGIVLSGPMIGVKRPIVLVGTPIAVHGQNDDAAFQNTATQFSHLYSQSATCAKTTVGNHAAYECGLAAATLAGTRVSGNAVFVLGSGNIYPVFCASPSDSSSRDVVNDPLVANRAKGSYQKTLSREDDESRSVYQKCDTVFQSIHLRKDLPQPQTAQAKDTTGPAAPAQSSTASANGGPSSSADAAPGTHQALAKSAQNVPSSISEPPASTVPAGFKIHSFNYCKSHNECWDASVLVPADAQLVSSNCKRYVFESKVQGTAFLLMAGPADGECDGNGASGPNLVRWKQLADPESNRAPGTYSTISSQTTKLAGKPATIITMGFRNGMDQWMGKRVEVESNGVPLVVGCMALRDHFDDGDAVCSTLIGSLQLP